MNCQSNLLRAKAMLLFATATVSALQGQTRSQVPNAVRSQATLLNLPLSFERQGQGTQERYVAQGQGYAIGLEKGRAAISLAPGAKAKGANGKLISIEF